MTNQIRFAYASVITGYFGLITLIMLWHTILSPSQRFPIALTLIISVVPLLFPLRGLLYNQANAITWAAYLSLFYFIHGVMEAAAEPAERLLAVLEIVLSLTLFFGATFYLRLTKSR